MFVCFAVKGGSGTTVVSAALALVLARTRPTLLVDLGGDLPAALGLPEPTAPGVGDWLASPAGDTTALRSLAVRVTDTLHVVPRGTVPPARHHERWAALAAGLAAEPAVVVDAGHPVAGDPPVSTLGGTALLVVRGCYLALRRAVTTQHRPVGVVLVREPGRVLGAADVERAVGAPVLAEVPIDPAIARAVDAGLLASRLPRTIAHPLRRLTES